MFPKVVCLLVFSLGLSVLACQPRLPPVDDTALLARQVWSSECVEFKPDSTGFRLDGLCCEYIRLPAIKLDQNRQFSLQALSYHSNGAGYTSSAITVSGELSRDGTELTVRYPSNSVAKTLQLHLGASTYTCSNCLCR